MNGTTITARATTGLVAAVAGFASYIHITAVARDAGEHGLVAAVLPLGIDGLILVGTLAMLEDKRDGRRPRLSARVAVAFGVIATLAANIASAEPTTTARLVAAVPPIAFLLSIEVLSRRGRRLPEPVPVELPAEPVEQPAVDPWVHAVPASDEPVPAPVADDKLSSAKPAKKAVRKRPPSSRDLVVAEHKRRPSASHAQIAARLNLSEQTVKRHRPRAAVEDAPQPKVNGSVPELEAVPS